MREIRTLRAMWRALETGLRQFLNGHEEGNLGYKPRKSLRAAAPVLDPTSGVCSNAIRRATRMGPSWRITWSRTWAGCFGLLRSAIFR